MKQHMLTHKIRDMPSRLFEHSKTAKPGGSLPTNLGPGAPIPGPIPGPMGSIGLPPPHSQAESKPTPSELAVHHKPIPMSLAMTMADPLKSDAVKRSPPESQSGPPIPKRQPSEYL